MHITRIIRSRVVRGIPLMAVILLMAGLPGCGSDDSDSGSCCPARIYGAVTSQAGAPLKGIEIRVAATGDFDTSDAAGDYAMEVYHRGTTLLTATDIDGDANGGAFDPVSYTVDLQAGVEMRVDFTLPPHE